MNKYEEKAKQFFESRTEYLGEYKKDEKIVNDKIGELINLIDTLEIAKTHAPMAAAELDKNISGYKKEIEAKEKNLKHIREQISRYQKELRNFQENICPHEKTTFDHDNYHTRVDYYKCDLCGAIV